MEDHKDALSYDKLLITQLNHVGDLITKFALQNYAASGAVLLAFFATKIPMWAAFGAVLILAINFSLAIAHNNWRLKVLYAAHNIARDAWFGSMPKGELFQGLKNNDQSNQLLAPPPFHRQFDWTGLAIISNLLPGFAAVVLLILYAIGTPLR